MEKINVASHARNELIDITNEIQKNVEQQKFNEGILVAFVPHTTAGITINEGADPDVAADIIQKLGNLVPEDPRFHHCEGNSDAHIKASLLGSSITIPVVQGRLQLGTWQHIFFYEGDGPRKRSVYITTIQKKDV